MSTKKQKRARRNAGELEPLPFRQHRTRMSLPAPMAAEKHTPYTREGKTLSVEMYGDEALAMKGLPSRLDGPLVDRWGVHMPDNGNEYSDVSVHRGRVIIGRLVCEMCRESFAVDLDTRVHIVVGSDNPRYLCTACGNTVDRVRSMKSKATSRAILRDMGIDVPEPRTITGDNTDLD